MHVASRSARRSIPSSPLVAAAVAVALAQATAARGYAADTAGDVVRNWNQIKRDDERGGEIFGDIPETLPSTLYAKKILKRAADAGHGSEPADGLLAEVKRVVDAGEDPELALRRAADEYRQRVEAE